MTCQPVAVSRSTCAANTTGAIPVARKRDRNVSVVCNPGLIVTCARSTAFGPSGGSVITDDPASRLGRRNAKLADSQYDSSHFGDDFRGLADGPSTYHFSGQGYRPSPRIQSGPKSAGKVLSRGLRVHFSVQPARVPMAAFQTLLKA